MGGAIQRRRLPTEQQHDHSIIDQRGKDACGLEALTRSHFTALRRRLEVYPPRSAQKQQGRKNSHNGVPGNLLDELVDNNRPTYKDRHARNSSWPGALCSTEGRIHLRRLVFSPSALSLQSDGGPYIRPCANFRFAYDKGIISLPSGPSPYSDACRHVSRLVIPM